MTRWPPTTKPVAYPLGHQFRKEITGCKAFGFFFVNSSSKDMVLRSCCLISSEADFPKPREASKHRTSATNTKLQSCLFIRASLRENKGSPNEDGAFLWHDYCGRASSKNLIGNRVISTRGIP